MYYHWMREILRVNSWKWKCYYWFTCISTQMKEQHFDNHEQHISLYQKTCQLNSWSTRFLTTFTNSSMNYTALDISRFVNNFIGDSLPETCFSHIWSSIFLVWLKSRHKTSKYSFALTTSKKTMSIDKNHSHLFLQTNAHV